MHSAVLSVFSQLGEFQAAMRSEANLSLLLTHGGRFHARLMRTTLNGMRLMEVQESLSRIGFVQVPSNEILVCLPGRRRPAPVWAGFELGTNELIVLGPGQCAHVRTENACSWKVFSLPLDKLSWYYSALTGRPPALPTAACFRRAPPLASRQLVDLHDAAIRMIRTSPEATASGEALHGLEQQLMDVLIECLSAGSMDAGSAEAMRMRDVTTRFERLLEGEATQRSYSLCIGEICSILGVSDRALRRSCAYNLGMSPSSYYRLHRMHLAHHALRRCGPDAVRICDAARRAGFLHLGRFAGAYRKLFGQSPSAILRGPQRGT